MEKSEYQVTVKIDTDEAVFEDQEEWAHGDNMNVEDQAVSGDFNKQNLQVINYLDKQRSRSPVTVQEWVATLPSVDNHEVQENIEDKVTGKESNNASNEDIDNIKLGEEAGFYLPGHGSVKNFGQLLLQKNNKNMRGSLKHSDTLASIKSDTTNSSMDSVLQSREADPEEVLYNLGFADSEALAKIPLRFLQRPSVAKGVSLDNFRRQQEEMLGRYETGFFGYRGLQGGLHRRPSELVDKILKTLREREREFHRTGSSISNGCHSIPSRFKVMDPNRTTFDSLVKQVKQVAGREKEKPHSFKSLARSVLSKENRNWRQEQIKSNYQKATQLLVIGGKSFIVDDEGNEEELESDSAETDDIKTTSCDESQFRRSIESGESGFNEEDDVTGGDSDTTQLVYTRNGDRQSFTQCFSYQKTNSKSAG